MEIVLFNRIVVSRMYGKLIAENVATCTTETRTRY